MKNVVIIPARAGSKGIINKNIINLCGKPLIGWTIEQARKSKRIDDVYVSTDGDNIAEVARQYGARVIWRPDELATDISSSEDALLHAIKEIEKESEIGLVAFLQATSPLRRHDDIDKAIETFLLGNYDSLFSMCVLEDYCMWKYEDQELTSWSYNYKMRGRRQDREPLYLENGSIYVFKPDVIKRFGNRLGGSIGMYEMPFQYSYEIDSMADIDICEYFMKKLIEGGNS